jgi:hypothetical protein
MIDVAFFRTVHIVSMVFWLGAIFFLVEGLIPSLAKREPDDRRLAAFAPLWDAFVAKTRVSVAVAGLSGLYLVWRLDAWARFAEARYWWMHVMLAVWAAYALVIYLWEPLRFRKLLAAGLGAGDLKPLTVATHVHQAFLGLALLTLLAAVFGSHGRGEEESYFTPLPIFWM